MMTPRLLFQKFNHAIAWNSFLMIIHYLSKTALTFVVYSRLSTEEFATWANVFSIVFILALWFDLGFRRSIPRYCPAFAHNARAKERFLTRLLTLYAGLLVVVNTAFIILAPHISVMLSLKQHLWYFYLGCALFGIESFISTLRLIFYAHFWQKQFNIVQTLITTLSTCILISLAFWAPSINLLTAIFYVAIGTGLLFIAASLGMLSFLYEDETYQHNRPIDSRRLVKEFAQHSGIMWLLTAINSLTERNILIPFFSLTLGHHAAGVFKVANDAALLFARFVIKVIGTPGTALLSHIETGFVGTKNERTALFGSALTHFHTRLFLLIGPLLIIVGLLFWLDAPYTIAPTIRPIFYLIVSMYFFQLLLMGLSKVLEVKREYSKLLLSMLPYLAIPGGYFLYVFQPSLMTFSLTTLIVIVHVIRLSTLSIRAGMALSTLK